MANAGQPSNSYTQGYSKHTLSTHLARTAEVDAAFLLPYIKKNDHILDAGCGPGTITMGFIKYATDGKVFGVDISADVVKKARSLAAEAQVPTQGPGSVMFNEGNILETLPYDDESFDIVFASQVFCHLKGTEFPLRALAELRRVLKPGAILATRDGTVQHFYPQRFDMDRLWGDNQNKVMRQGAEATGIIMPALLRQAGFDADGGKVLIGAGARALAGIEGRKFLAARATAQLSPGDPFRQGWMDAGIPEEEMSQVILAVNEWANTPDAWFVGVQAELLAWK